MGYKIPDVKADIIKDIERICHEEFGNDRSIIQEDLLDIVDKHFKKIER